MNWITNLFKKKAPPKSPTLLAFTVENFTDPTDSDVKFFTGVNVKDGPGFLDFLRNSDYNIDITQYSDQELAHLFVYSYCQRWLAEHSKKPMFVETHSFPAHGEIRYDRSWNKSFIGSVTNMGFEALPSTEEELVDMYMNYVYGTRLMEELEAAAEADPSSISHPELSDPQNKFKR